MVGLTRALVTRLSRGKIEVRSPTDMRYSETKDVIVKEQEGTCMAGDYVVGSYYKGADTSQEKLQANIEVQGVGRGLSLTVSEISLTNTV